MVNKITVNNQDSNYTHSIFDISEYTGNSYLTLSDALDEVPIQKRKGGMTIRYVPTNDNKYVQYRLMATSFSTTEADWQGVDEEPTKNSKNLIESGGVYYEVARLNNKLIKLTGFGTSATAAGATEVGNCYYNTSTNTIRLIVSVGNESNVPFYDGAIYTCNNELYVYNGTTLVKPTQSLVDELGLINSDIFGLSGALSKTGDVSSVSGFLVTPFIPVTVGETVKVGGYTGGSSYNYSLMCLYKADKSTLVGAYGNDDSSSGGFTELEMVIPSEAAYMRVGSRNDVGSIAYISRSYVHAKILSKLAENMLKAYFNTGENVNDVSIDSVLSNNNHLVKGSAIVEGINNAKNELLEDISDLREDLYGTQSFDNAVLTDTGKITFGAITLHEDGDELDIELLPGSGVSGTNSGEYALTFGDAETRIRVGISRGGVSVRADDNTWIYGPAGDGGTGSSKHAYKVKYTGGNIEIWKDTTLLRTYTGQKDISIYGIGSQGMATKWFGTIYRFAYTHNGVTSELLNLTGFTKNDGVTINYVREGGDIPELQAQNYPKFEIHPTTDNVEVYFRLNKDIYGNLPIKHIEITTDNAYANFWGIENKGNDIGYICQYVNGSFVNLTQRLLVGAENEFAIQFYQDDFTGGTHGDERIDLDNTCYVVFIVDGKEYSISELIALGNIQCNSFSYRQRSVLYTRYEDTGTHDPIAYHMKDTEFVEGGYITRNNIEMLQAMTALNTYSGLVCVHKDIADYVVDNTGKVFTATHPSSASVISGISNKVDMRIRMYKGNASCVLDSKVIGGNVADFNTAPSNITIWDRQSDTKYYAVLPTNVSLLATSVFGFETNVRFDYRDDV